MIDHPDLAALLSDPARAAEVPAVEVPALLDAVTREAARLGVLKAVLAARLASASNGHHESDRLLTVDEAAERLGVTRDWLRRRPELPFVVKLSEGVVRYSGHGIGDWIAARLGGPR